MLTLILFGWGWWWLMILTIFDGSDHGHCLISLWKKHTHTLKHIIPFLPGHKQIPELINAVFYPLKKLIILSFYRSKFSTCQTQAGSQTHATHSDTQRPESFQATKQQVYCTRYHRASDARRGGHRQLHLKWCRSQKKTLYQLPSVWFNTKPNKTGLNSNEYKSS